MSIIQYFWEKFLITLPLGIFVMRDEYYAIIYGLFIMVAIDSVLGIWVAIKHKVFISYKLRKIASKMSIYFMALMSIWVLCSVSPTIFGWAFNFFGTFLILTELFSNLEKLSLLGLEIPSKLLSRLNQSFKDYYYGADDSIRKEALKKILDKN